MSFVYAQDMELQLSQPVIYGKVGGVEVVTQGDVVAFLASGQRSPLMNHEACDQNLHCAMQKNRTGMVVLSSKQLLIYDRPLNPLNPLNKLPDNATHTDPLYPDAAEIIRYSNIPINPATATIALDFPQPTATLHTGNEVIDKTSGVLWVSSQIMTWLAKAVTTFSNTRQMLATNSGDMLTPIIEPSSTQQQNPLPSLTETENELLKSLMSTSIVPMPSPTPVLVEDGLGVEGSVRVVTGFDRLMIRPSPSGPYQSSSQTAAAFSGKIKQAPISSGSGTETKSAEEKTGSTISTSGITESLQASVLPSTDSTAVAANQFLVVSSNIDDPSEEDIEQLLSDMEKMDLPELPAELVAMAESEEKSKPVSESEQPPLSKDELQELMQFAIDEGNTAMMISVAEDIVRSWELGLIQEGRSHLLKPEKEVEPVSQMTYQEMRKLIDLYGDDHGWCRKEKSDLHTAVELEEEARSLGAKKANHISKRFDENGDLYHWRTVPEYTADEKRRLLAKARRFRFKDGYETHLDTAKRIAALNRMTDDELHKKHNDLEIHEAMRVDAAIAQPISDLSLSWRLTHDFDAQEKRKIIQEYFKQFSSSHDKSASTEKWQQVSDNDVHREFGDEKVRQMQEQCKRKSD